MNALDLDKYFEKEEAAKFLNTPRGKYLIGKALHTAISDLSSVPPPHPKEHSDIKDMQYLLDTLFASYMIIRKCASGV